MIYSCKEIVELLIDFVADELPPEHRSLVEKHLCCCPPCHAYLETYQITIKLTRRLPCQPMPDSLVERLQAVVEAVRREAESKVDDDRPRNC
jgi:anti-sigma factor RsiW